MKRRTFLEITGAASALVISGEKPKMAALAAAEQNSQNPAVKNEILKKIMAVKKGATIC